MKERTWTIGSLPECDLRVESATVSGRHCRLTQRGQMFLIEDLGSTNGTFLAGQRIDGPREVRRGEAITLGLNTPMPWPNLSSITVGRLPENDVVIPLDVVSGRHARVEREGNCVFLVDLESRNGTALNGPLNKIARAAIQNGDVVFLGTHKIMARDLLAALPPDAPEPVRQGTRLEAPAPEVSPFAPRKDVKAEPSPAAETTSFRGAKGDTPSPTPPPPSSPFSSYQSPRSWAVGIGLSAACVLIAIGTSWAVRAGSKDKAGSGEDRQAEPQSVAIVAQPATTPEPARQREKTVTATLPPPRPTTPEFDEQAVRNSEQGVYMLSIRTGDVVFFIRSTAWAISPTAIVCPTDALKHWEGILKKGDKLDDCIVVCSPSKTLRILKHSALDGEGGFVSVGRLEAPAEAVSFDSRAASEFVPEPGQELAALVADGAPSAAGKPNDAPATISRRLIKLKIDRIERDAQQAPVAWCCKAAEDPGLATAAPVFDGAGRAVGCVESATKTDVRVVPISRLTALSQIEP